MDPPQVDASYLSSCWLYLPQNNSEIQPNLALSQRDGIIHKLLPELIGFTVYTILFVLALLISLLCLYYLFNKDKNKNSLHFTSIGFSITISGFNLAAFALRSNSIIADVRLSTCPEITISLGDSPWSLGPSVDFSSPHLELDYVKGIYSSEILSLILLPIFLWFTDAFLLYRAWIIWVGLRKYIFLPALGLVASIVAGIVWTFILTASFLKTGIAPWQHSLATALTHWVPAVGFSVGLDALTTGMIAGRLIYHHRSQVKSSGACSSLPLLPLVTIFIESAALSLISKVLQLTITSIAIQTNPLVIPLCTISSNLIILRKALGIDAFNNPSKDAQNLPPIHFQSRHSQPHLGTSWGHLETLVVRGVGGNPEVSENTNTGNANSVSSHSERR